MRLEGIPPRHCDHRRRAGQRRLLRARARPAPGQEDRQPGRPDGLPPVLCRRARLSGADHHLLRVPRRAARPCGRRHGARVSFSASHPTRRSTSGRIAWARKASRSRGRTGASRSPDPEGLGLELAVVETDDEPLTAENPEIPADPRPSSTACARSPATPGRAERSSRSRWSHPKRRGELRDARRAARRLLSLRRHGPGRIPGHGNRPPRRLGVNSGETRRGASA